MTITLIYINTNLVAQTKNTFILQTHISHLTSRTNTHILQHYPNVKNKGTIEYEILDTSSINSTNKFINRILSKSKQSKESESGSENENPYTIDYLILNAGIAKIPDNMNITTNSKEGSLNRMFATNHFGHWLITYKLYNLLIQSGEYRVKELSLNGRDNSWLNKYGAPIRVVSISSEAHSHAAYGLYDKKQTTTTTNATRKIIGPNKFDKLDDIDNDKYFQRISKGNNISDCSYGDSKLLNIFHMQYMQRLLTISQKDDLIWCVSVTPGMTRTDVFEKHGFGVKIFKYVFYPLFWFLSKNVHMGCQTILHVCANNETNIKGSFYNNCLQTNAIDSIKRMVKGQHQESQHLWDSCKQLWMDVGIMVNDE